MNKYKVSEDKLNKSLLDGTHNPDTLVVKKLCNKIREIQKIVNEILEELGR